MAAAPEAMLEFASQDSAALAAVVIVPFGHAQQSEAIAKRLRQLPVQRLLFAAADNLGPR